MRKAPFAVSSMQGSLSANPSSIKRCMDLFTAVVSTWRGNDHSKLGQLRHISLHLSTTKYLKYGLFLDDKDCLRSRLDSNSFYCSSVSRNGDTCADAYIAIHLHVTAMMIGRHNAI